MSTVGHGLASSDGALFEYSSDQTIIANLRALHSRTSLVVGSVFSNFPIRREQIETMRFALHPHGLEGFRPLAELAENVIERTEVTPQLSFPNAPTVNSDMFVLGY